MAIQDATVPAAEGEWIEPGAPERELDSLHVNPLRRALAGVLPEDMWNRPKPPQADPLSRSESHERVEDVDGLYEPPTMTGVSTASTGDLLKGKPSKAIRELYATIGKALVAAGGGLANMAARDDDEDPVWLMTDEEAEGIALPLANIAARKAPLNVGDGDGDTNDLVDGMMAVLGIAVYAGRTLLERAARRKAKRQGAPLQDAAEAAAA